MNAPGKRQLHLPKSDRAYWKSDVPADSLRYLAWGRRDFDLQPIPATLHDGWVCALIEEGSPMLRAASVSQKLSAGMLALIGPDCESGWKPSGSGTCRILIWMWSAFGDADLNRESRDGFRIRVLDGSGRKAFRTLHDLCRREVLRDAPSARYLEGCRMMFEETVRRELTRNSPNAAPLTNLCGQAEAWMAAHLDSSEPIARICDYLNVSQPTLYRHFMKEKGTSPLDRFQDLKMREAKRLLSGKTLSVKEVAFRLGYAHFNDLSRAYRKHFGQCATRKS
jgi:AraC-like DNA-binding protein